LTEDQKKANAEKRLANKQKKKEAEEAAAEEEAREAKRLKKLAKDEDRSEANDPRSILGNMMKRMRTVEDRLATLEEERVMKKARKE
jgi:hypothetical protein